VQQALRIESYCCTSTKIIIKEIAARIINKTKTKQSKETNKKTRQKHKTTKEQRNKHLIGVTHCLSETTIKIEYNIYSIFVQTYVTMNKMT
jgi:ERCC4-type nuclease